MVSVAVSLRMQVAAPWYISHHRPPATSRKIGSMLRAGGGSGAERRSRNSVRVRSYALGKSAPVAVWTRARIRVSSPAAWGRTPHEYPGERASSRCTSRRCAYFGRERTPGRVGRVARALAAVFWWWCVALLRLVALCAPPPGSSGVGASPPPSARAAEDASSAAACASAPSNTTTSTPPPPSPTPPTSPTPPPPSTTQPTAPIQPAHTGQYPHRFI